MPLRERARGGALELGFSLDECGEGIAPGVEQCGCLWLGKVLDKSEGRVCGLLV